ncbi:MAG: tRNA lysidine(34) synthetase TilS [Bradymonadales bacterium]
MAKVQTFINSEGLLLDGERVDIALSGGADSVALCAILAAMAAKRAYKLRALHIRHGLRDDAQDEEISLRVAEKIGIAFESVHLDLAKHGLSSNVEAAAREARYEVLRQKAKDANATCIALGHNGDENLETAIWRLTRGCGIEGLTLRPKRYWAGLKFIRPLLMQSKDELYDFLQDCGLPWVEDPSNQSQIFLRNQIRHNALAPIKELATNPSSIYRSLHNLAKDALAVEGLSEAALELCVWHDDLCLLPHKIYDIYGSSAFSQLFRHASRRLIAQYQARYDFVQDILSCYTQDRRLGRKLSDRGLMVEFSSKYLLLYPADAKFERQNDIVQIAVEELDVFPPKSWELAPYGRLRLLRMVANHWKKPTTECFAMTLPERAVLSIEFAHMHPRFSSDTHGVDSLDALRAMGIPRVLRNNYPVLCLNNQALCILGGSRSALAQKPTKSEALLVLWEATF